MIDPIRNRPAIPTADDRGRAEAGFGSLLDAFEVGSPASAQADAAAVRPRRRDDDAGGRASHGAERVLTVARRRARHELREQLERRDQDAIHVHRNDVGEGRTHRSTGTTAGREDAVRPTRRPHDERADASVGSATGPQEASAAHRATNADRSTAEPASGAESEAAASTAVPDGAGSADAGSADAASDGATTDGATTSGATTDGATAAHGPARISPLELLRASVQDAPRTEVAEAATAAAARGLAEAGGAAGAPGGPTPRVLDGKGIALAALAARATDAAAATPAEGATTGTASAVLTAALAEGAAADGLVQGDDVATGGSAVTADTTTVLGAPSTTSVRATAAEEQQGEGAAAAGAGGDALSGDALAQEGTPLDGALDATPLEDVGVEPAPLDASSVDDVLLDQLTDGGLLDGPVLDDEAVAAARSTRAPASNDAAGRTAMSAGTSPVDAAGPVRGPSTVAAPTRPVAAPQSAATLLAQRVAQAADELRTAPPPRTVLLEFADLDGLRLQVSVRDGQVHVTPQGPANVDLRALDRELQQALADRGLDLASDTDGDDRRGDRGSDASTAAERRDERMGRRGEPSRPGVFAPGNAAAQRDGTWL